MFHKIFTTKVMEKDPCIGSNLDKLECPLPAHEDRCCEAPVLCRAAQDPMWKVIWEKESPSLMSYG